MTPVAVRVVEPSASSGSVDHADFLEFSALLAPDRNSSVIDLRRNLNRSGSAEEYDPDGLDEDAEVAILAGDEVGESIAASVSLEIADRAKGAGLGYPFSFDGSVVQASSGAQNRLYTFLLLLSLVGPKTLDGRDPTRIFEDVSAAAAERYFGGPHGDVLCYHFGFPRRIRPKGFLAAVDDLCVLLGEGQGNRKRPTTKNQKDAGLDIVVARRFPDRRSGQVIGFGQCAAGKLWRTKLNDLMPTTFCKRWLTDMPAVEPSRLFFLPFCVEFDEWADTTIQAGVVFDRCRIAHFAHAVGDPVRGEYRAWTASALKELRR